MGLVFFFSPVKDFALLLNLPVHLLLLYNAVTGLPSYTSHFIYFSVLCCVKIKWSKRKENHLNKQMHCYALEIVSLCITDIQSYDP